MKYNQLGTSDLKVSEISFGCMSLPDDQQESIALLQQAFGKGINFFDTADLYQKGENEVMVGKAFKGMREKVIIASKVGNQWRQDGSGWDWNPRKAYILQAVDKSLQRLQTDYIDLYQLHGGTLDDPIDETIEAFELLKEQGKIRCYGISSIRPNVIREWVNRSGIVSVMMQYSLLDRRPEEKCLGLLQANKVSVLARGSLAKGLLAGKQPASYLEHSTEEVAMAAEVIRKMAKAPQAMAALAIRFVLAHPAVATAVTGIRTEGQLLNNLYATQVPVLSEKEMHQLDKAAKIRVYDQHRE